MPGPPDAYCGVKGDLEGGTLVLRADHGLELLGVHHTLHLCKESGGGGNGLFRGLALQANRRKGKGRGGSGGQGAGSFREQRITKILFKWLVRSHKRQRFGSWLV